MIQNERLINEFFFNILIWGGEGVYAHARGIKKKKKKIPANHTHTHESSSQSTRVHRMEGKELVFDMFLEFMAKVVKLEELAGGGSRLLGGFRQGLEFIRRPPINKTSKLMEQILLTNETKKLSAYVEAGCVKTHDKIENFSNLHTSQLGLYDYLSKARHILDELEGILQKVTSQMSNLNRTEPKFKDETEPLEFQNPGVTDYAVMMGVIYSMLKRDFDMQKKIITSLCIKSTSGELESYSMMWSLRPYISDEILHQAYKLIP